ncbi:MAG TPA: tetratricopeptide repeat protein [Thioalkalivibrio sp.]|nr:tetratricopeptide repeat protein [Thioalkalivibrio sp.]
MTFFAELKRRNVIRVGAAYVVVAWLVIQVVETIFPAFGFGDVAVRYTTIVFAIGFIPALIFAWAFELTPEGLKKESEVDRSQSVTPQTGKKLDRAIMVVLALGLAFFAFDKFVLDPQREAELVELKAAAVEQARQAGRTEALVESYGDKSIAVLPFVNMSADPEQEYLGDGIAEEMLNLLARIPELRVISRSSAFSFKEQNLEIREIAKRLNVMYVLEGSVRRSGNRIRITAQLIEARSDTHLWSEVYDRTLDDIFEIQDEVAEEVVKQLHVTLLGGPPEAEEANPLAYLKLLQARHILGLQQYENLDHAEALLQSALELDPRYVDALVILYFIQMEQVRQSDRNDADGREALIARVEETVARVLALDPDNPVIKASMAWHRQDELGLSEAARLVEEAVRVAPRDVSVLFFAADFSVATGKLDEAIQLSEYIAERDPLFFWAQLNLAEYYFQAGHSEDALERFEIARQLNPTAGAVRWKTGLARLMLGDAEGALEEFESEPGPIYRLHGLALAYHDLGRQQESAAAMEQLLPTETDAWPFGLARAYAWMGNMDEAFHYLERAAEQHKPQLNGAATNPLLQRLHDDPRWLPFLRSIGQAPEQLAAIEFNVEPPR